MSAIAQISNLLSQLILSTQTGDRAECAVHWSRDAVLYIERFNQRKTKLSGRDEIIRQFSAVLGQEERGVSFFVATPIIDVKGNTAQARSFIIRSKIGAVPHIVGFAEVWDTLYCGSDERWLITERTLSI